MGGWCGCVLSELGFLGLTGLGSLVWVCIYDRWGWADLKGACVSGMDSWPLWIPACAGMTIGGDAGMTIGGDAGMTGCLLSSSPRRRGFQAVGWIPRLFPVDSRLRGNDEGGDAGMTGRCAGVTRGGLGPCGFLALWVPAFAGMTGRCAGMTKGEAGCIAGGVRVTKYCAGELHEGVGVT